MERWFRGLCYSSIVLVLQVTLHCVREVSRLTGWKPVPQASPKFSTSALDERLFSLLTMGHGY